jgi:hypothetical protein
LIRGELELSVAELKRSFGSNSGEIGVDGSDVGKGT